MSVQDVQDVRWRVRLQDTEEGATDGCSPAAQTGVHSPVEFVGPAMTSFVSGERECARTCKSPRETPTGFIMHIYANKVLNQCNLHQSQCFLAPSIRQSYMRDM